MRVLFYTTVSEWSASQRVMVTVARGLVSRGHSVTVACCAGSAVEATAQAEGIETVAVDAESSTAGGAWVLRKTLAEKFVEVAIVTNERDQLLVSSAMRLASRGCVLRRLEPFEKFEVQRGGKLALKLATAGLIVATDREIKEGGVPGWTIPMHVAPIGIEASTYDEIEPADRADVGASTRGTLIVCHYDPSGRYRLGVVFRTLALLAQRHANIHVAVVGPGSQDDQLRLHAAALGVGPVVSFLGPRIDELRVMRAAEAGWVASSGDAGALACLDFAALRVPVIAERSPLTQHYVAAGITGLLLAPGDPSYTASAVAAFLSGQELHAAMGNAGRTRVQRDFPESAMIDGFENAVNAAGDRTQWATT
jgi:glycosyltransferase involved in cell wall biosynthesis